jgi:ribosomal protein S24E
MIKNIKTFEQFKIIKKEKLSQDDKIKELDKIVNKYGISTTTGNMRTYDDYLRFKKINPDFKYAKLDDELNDKKKELNFLRVIKYDNKF